MSKLLLVLWLFSPAAYSCDDWWCNSSLTKESVESARKGLIAWESALPRMRGLTPLPHKGSLLTPYLRDPSNPNDNLYGQPRLHRVLLKASKFVELLCGRTKKIPVFRLNTTHPPERAEAQYAHANGIAADLGYILKEDGNPKSTMDLECQFWFVAMLFEAAEKESGVGWLATAYAEELKTYGRWAQKKGLIEKVRWMDHMTTDFELYHVSHLHFGLRPR